MTNAIAAVVIREGEPDRVAELERRVEGLTGLVERLVAIVEQLAARAADDRAAVTGAQLARVVEVCIAGIDDGR